MKLFHAWFLDSVHPALEEALSAAGMVCHDATSLTRAALMAHSSDKDNPPIHGLVLRSRIELDRQILEALPELKWIARSGSGLETIDVQAASDRGISVFSSPEGNRDAVGEHVIGMLLNVLNHMRSGDESIRSRRWEREKHRGRELKALTVGIMGYGQMGSALGAKLAGFGCRVLAYDKYKQGWGESPSAHWPLPHVEPVGWKKFQSEVDVVSLHLPWTDETRQLVDDAWLRGFDKPIVFINTSRGPIVRTEALLSALDDGRVTDACLDVLETEGRSLEGLEGLHDPHAKKVFDELLAHPRVLLSPHVAGWTEESYAKLSLVLVEKILQSAGWPID